MYDSIASDVIRHPARLEIMPTWSLDEENSFVS